MMWDWLSRRTAFFRKRKPKDTVPLEEAKRWKEVAFENGKRITLDGLVTSSLPALNEVDRLRKRVKELEEHLEERSHLLEALLNVEKKYSTLRRWLRARHPESHKQYFHTHYEPVEGSWITNDEGKEEPGDYVYVGGKEE